MNAHYKTQMLLQSKPNMRGLWSNNLFSLDFGLHKGVRTMRPDICGLLAQLMLSLCYRICFMNQIRDLVRNVFFIFPSMMLNARVFPRSNLGWYTIVYCVCFKVENIVSFNALMLELNKAIHRQYHLIAFLMISIYPVCFLVFQVL